MLVSLASFLPIWMGDCGAAYRTTLEACLDTQSRMIGLFSIVWMLTLANLIWQHLHRSRWQLPSYFAFIILPIASALGIASV